MAKKATPNMRKRINTTLRIRIRHEGASFEPLTAMIGPTGRSVARRMKPKKEKKNRRLKVAISRMRRHGPFEPIDPNTCMWGGVRDIINRANFFENRPKGFGAGRPRNMAFPIGLGLGLGLKKSGLANIPAYGNVIAVNRRMTCVSEKETNIRYLSLDDQRGKEFGWNFQK